MKPILAILGILAMLFVMPAISTLVGAFSGWVVGLFFGQTIIGFLAAMGVATANLTMWQVGAAMGFLGSFLRTSVSKT